MLGCQQSSAHNTNSLMRSKQFDCDWHLFDVVFKSLSQFFVIAAVIDENNFFQKSAWRFIANTPERSDERRPGLIIEWYDNRCLRKFLRVINRHTTTILKVFSIINSLLPAGSVWSRAWARQKRPRRIKYVNWFYNGWTLRWMSQIRIRSIRW